MSLLALLLNIESLGILHIEDLELKTEDLELVIEGLE